MAYKTPPEITAAAAATGTSKIEVPVDKLLVSGMLAGAYIAFGGLVAVIATAGLNPATFGGLIPLITGAVFTVGLIIVVIAGADLVTGNMSTVGIATLQRKVSVGKYSFHLSVVLLGNLIGALFVAYFMATKTGLLAPASPAFGRLSAIATLKAKTETDSQIFIRAIGCNWLVCLAIWMAMAADDIGGKILAIFFPILAFVAMGFDHVVANMFFLPTAMFAHVPGIAWADVGNNLLFALLGNLVGAGVFVAGAYYYLYGRTAPERSSAKAEGRVAAEGSFAEGLS